MKITLGAFPRSPGEMRVELDTERRCLLLAFYVPQLGHAPHCHASVAIYAREVREVARLLFDGLGQLTAARMRGTEDAS